MFVCERVRMSIYLMLYLHTHLTGADISVAIIKIATESGSQCISRYYITVLFLFNNLHEFMQFPVLIRISILVRNASSRKCIKYP